MRNELKSLEGQMREKQLNVTRCSQAIERHGREVKALRIAMQKAEDVVEQLQDALDRDAIEEGRLDALKDQLKEAEEERATHAGSYEDSVIASDNAKETLGLKREELSTIDLRIQEAMTKLEKAKSRSEKIAEQRRKAMKQKDAAIEEVSKAKKLHAEHEKDRVDKIAVVADFTEQASKICSRVPVDPGETASSIDKKLAKLEKDVERFEEQ